MANKRNDSSNDTENGGKRSGGKSEYENFQSLLKQVLSVPKEEVDKKRREEQQRQRRAG